MLGLACLALVAAAPAEVRLGSLFTSNMVFQQRTDAPVWGWAKPGEKVSIRTTWGANAETVAGKDGKWMLKLHTKEAGGPYEVAVSGENSLWLRNVMLGEVWVCSGQSNMEWPVGVHRGLTPINGADDEVKNATHPGIRLFQVTKKMADAPEATCGGSWTECSPKSVFDFSATAYFYARYLNETLKVPVGVINTSWGGTEVELWMSEPAMKSVPELGSALAANKAAAAAYDAAAADREKKMASDLGTTENWQQESLDDAAWTRITNPDQWEKMELKDLDGSVWYRAKVLLTEAQAKNACVLHLGIVDDDDETWVNGQRIGSTKNPQAQRDYTIPAGLLRDGFNLITVRVVDTGGLGGFMTPGLVGLESGPARIPLTNWRYRIAVDLRSAPLPPEGKNASLLYNGMIAPLIPFAIRGAIWYQGESNVSRAYQYRTSFPTMIHNWRQDWKQGDFPFYFVQIAPYEYKQDGASAELREAQALTLKASPNTGMVVITDITGDVTNIHPTNKQDVGKRLALVALANTYGQKVACSGPMYRDMKVQDNKIRISFDHAEGLKIVGDKLEGILIAGADKQLVPAEARVEGNDLIVWSDAVKKPVSVRFGWGDAVVTNLANGAGLPAAPFRTDTWPCMTLNVKW